MSQAPAISQRKAEDVYPEIFRQHALWLNTGYCLGFQANLAGADLRDLDFRATRLERAVLIGADLRGADLPGVNLRSARLQRADLRGASLRGANLLRADLSDAALVGADLEEAMVAPSALSQANRAGLDTPRDLTELKTVWRPALEQAWEVYWEAYRAAQCDADIERAAEQRRVTERGVAAAIDRATMAFATVRDAEIHFAGIGPRDLTRLIDDWESRPFTPANWPIPGVSPAPTSTESPSP